MGKTFSTGLLTNAIKTTSANNVGIGTSSPNTYLTINDGAGSRTNSQDFTANGNSTKGHIGQFNNKLYISSNWYYNGNQNADSTSFGQANIVFDTQNVSTGTNINFGTSEIGSTVPIERMRITSGGNVGIGTSSPTGMLNTKYSTGELRFSITNGREIEAYSNGSRGNMDLLCNNLYISNLGTGTVYSNGGVLTNTNPSDENLKENITDLTFGLNEILKLRPVSYDWKNNIANQSTQYGFIAQEVQKVLPQLVTEFDSFEDKEREVATKRLGLDKDAIFISLVKAIQEQNEIITKQGQAIEELKALIAAK